MSEEYFRAELAWMLHNGFGSGEEITIPAEVETKIITALVQADRLWGVRGNGDGFVLEWFRDGIPVEVDSRLTPAVMRKLADALEALSSSDAGIPVTFGMSGSGYTYLNIRLEDSAAWAEIPF
jgi:hypothetical protein